MACTDLIPLIGRSLLFIGNECQHWQIADFVNATHQARALGFEAIVPKKFDGINHWYTDIPSLQAEREAVEAAGCKYVPFGYLYGPVFGNDQITAECHLLAELQSACHGVAVADMETEWNGQVAAAQLFTATMQKLPPGTLIISTWADPFEQSWQGVIGALAPQVDAWWPQEYDNWLAAAATSEFAKLNVTCVQPTVYVTSAIGPNDVLAIIKQKLTQGKEPISVWEYQMALANPALAKSITALIASLEGDPVKTISLSDPVVANFFTQAPGNAWQCTVPGHQYVVGNALLEFYRSFNGSDSQGWCGLTYLGLPLGGEQAIPTAPGATTQRMERGTLVYDPGHKNDSPPGAGSVYLAHIDQVPSAEHTAIQQIKTIVAPL